MVRRRGCWGLGDLEGAHAWTAGYGLSGYIILGRKTFVNLLYETCPCKVHAMDHGDTNNQGESVPDEHGDRYECGVT